MFSSTYLSLVCLICCSNGVDVQEVVFGVVSKNVEINCSIPETQPEWRGPPTLVVYFNADASATVNPSLPNKDRVSVNANGNLVISSAEVTDGGEFRCSYFADSVLFDVRIGCRLLDIPQHGSVNSTFGYPGDTAVFSCNQSYGLSGTEILTCLADGSWTADEPECESTTTTPVDNNTSDLGAIIGGVGAAAVLGICCGGAVMYGRNTTPNKPRGCRYNSTTKILKWERPKELPVLPTKNVTKYHIEIEMGLLTPEEIEHLRNTNGKLNNQGWLDITKEDATKDKDQQEDPQKDPQTSCQIDGLTAGKEYNFRVYAENGNGLSSAAYSKTGGNVDSGDSACCGRNNSILPICTGGDQHPSDGNKQKISHRPRHRDADTHQPGEPNSKTTKTDESGSFVSGKDIKVDTGGSSSFRAQPPLPGIKSEKKNTRGLSANIDDSDIINPSYEKTRLTPIGQESHPGWEEKTDRSENGKEKKKKRKSKDKDKERDSNVTESADL